MGKVNAGRPLTQRGRNAEQGFGQAELRTVDNFGGCLRICTADIVGKLVEHIKHQFVISIFVNQSDGFFLFTAADVKVGDDLQGAERHFQTLFINDDFVMFAGFGGASEIVVNHPGMEVIESTETRFFFNGGKLFERFVGPVFPGVSPGVNQRINEFAVNLTVELIDGFDDFGITALFHFFYGDDDVGDVVFIAFLQRYFGVARRFGNSPFGGKNDINTTEQILIVGVFVESFNVIVGSGVEVFAQMGDAAGEVSSVGFLNSGGSRCFRLRSRSFYFLLVGAGIEKDKSRKNDQYVADFCHN